MDIGLSFEAGIPVLALAGRFDGAAAAAFDERISGINVDVPQWVVDMSGVAYLSSLGIRSLVTLDKRLKARDGGLVLASITPLVLRVLHVSGLEPFLRIVPTADVALATARASAAAGPTIENAFSGGRARVRRMAGAESTLEWWAPPIAPRSSPSLLGVSASDLGIAFGLGVLGDVSGGSVKPGRFVSTPHFAGMLAEEGSGITDFVVGDASQIVPIGVSSAVGLSGAPAAIVELESPAGLSLLDALDDMFECVGSSAPPALGFVALTRSYGKGSAVCALGVAFDPVAAAGTIDAERRLEGIGGQVSLPSGRRVAGGAVSLRIQPAIEGFADIHESLRSQATLDALAGMTGLVECAPLAKALVWLFVPRAVRNGIDKLLQVAVETGGEWRPEWDAIIRRLYHECRSVTLTHLPGGFMSSTFKSVAYDHDGRRTLPSVVKIGPTELTRREQQANREYVSRFILNNGTTVLGEAQSGDWAGLRYNFLGVNGPDSRLVWLYDVYPQRPVQDIVQLLERLFTTVLKPWYAQPKWEQVFLFRDHSPLRLFPTLIETAEQLLGIQADAYDFDCPELGVRLPNPFRFLRDEYPRRAGGSRLWYTSVCHGDLNLRNVLVDERDNLYVIDFSETRPRNVVSDFARLEPVLKFEMTRVESDDDVRRLVEFEEALTSVTALDQPPPFRYRGNDPLVARAHAAITLLRRCADRATLFETDVVPYWLAMLEWTYSVICYRQLSVRHKRYAACSAALICRSILQLEGGA